MDPDISKSDQISIKLCRITEFAKRGDLKHFDSAVAELHQLAEGKLKESEIRLLEELHRTSRLAAITYNLKCAWDVERTLNHRPGQVERLIATAEKLGREIGLNLRDDSDFEKTLNLIHGHQEGVVTDSKAYHFCWEEAGSLPPIRRRRRR